MNGLYEAFCIIVVFPLIVAIGAGQRDARAVSNRLCRIFGDISYPLYITHYPLIYIYTAWIARGPRTLGQRTGWGILLWCTAVAIGYASLKLYDEPVRAWLSRRFLRSGRGGGAVHIPGTDPAFASDQPRALSLISNETRSAGKAHAHEVHFPRGNFECLSRCQVGSLSIMSGLLLSTAFDECKEVSIDLFCVCGRHAVREPGV